jgi:hypothetical protein
MRGLPDGLTLMARLQIAEPTDAPTAFIAEGTCLNRHEILPRNDAVCCWFPA